MKVFCILVTPADLLSTASIYRLPVNSNYLEGIRTGGTIPADVDRCTYAPTLRNFGKVEMDFTFCIPEMTIICC